jgi:hypothetical protein
MDDEAILDAVVDASLELEEIEEELSNADGLEPEEVEDIRRRITFARSNLVDAGIKRTTDE